MKNLFIFAFLVFSLTGLLAPSAISDVYSEKGGNDKAKGNPQGCDNEKGKDATQNPNCDGTTPGESDKDGDGIPDSEDACPNKRPNTWILEEPDHDGDGIIDSEEIIAGTNPCR